tara:strand:- start:470 stop:1315 length:846 start_codon:yes stop_codon:yes gene_type:complete
VKNILIIGASSFVGQSLISGLDQNFNIFGTFNKKKIKNKNFIYLNLKDKLPIKKLTKFKNIHTVIWCVQSNNKNIKKKNLYEINITGLIKIMDFLKTIKIKKFIFFSSGSVYSKSKKKLSEHSKINLDDYYSFVKILGEKICQIYSESNLFDLIILRPFTIYGKNQKSRLIYNLIFNIKNENKIYLEGKEGIKLSTIYVDDIPQIIKYLILNYRPHYSVFNLSSPFSYSVKKFCELIANKFNKDVKISTSKIINKNLVSKKNILNKKFKFLSFEKFIKECV